MNYIEKELLISLKQRVIDIEKLLRKPNIKRWIEFISIHEGDGEAIIEMLEKCYGIGEYPGYDLFEEILKKEAKKKDFLRKIIFWRKK